MPLPCVQSKCWQYVSSLPGAQFSKRHMVSPVGGTLLPPHGWWFRVRHLPVEMQRAMAKQAEAEREKRAKIIHAEGEFQAAQRLADAAHVIASEPSALQLRYLQTLSEISTENSSTTIFPIPIDILRPFYTDLDSKLPNSDPATSQE